jgi:SPP1 family predicted phage head-tail adaptor
MSGAATLLRYYITIQSRPPGSNDAGELNDWQEHLKVWADIRAMGGIEAIKANAITSAARASVRIRNRSGLNSGMRILHGSTIYEVLSVPPYLAAERFMDLVCEVVT